MALYLQDQVKIDRSALSLTGRHDWADAETVSTAVYPFTGTKLQKDRATTGRVGINYLFDFGLDALRELHHLVPAYRGHRSFRQRVQADDGRGQGDRHQVQAERDEPAADSCGVRDRAAERADRRSGQRLLQRADR